MKQGFRAFTCETSFLVAVAQLVRAAVCGTAGRRFETGQPPKTVCKNGFEPNLDSLIASLSNIDPLIL